MTVPDRAASSAKSISELGVRPGNIVLTEPWDETLNGTVVLTEQLGSETLVYVDVAGGEPIVVKARGGAAWKARQQVGLGIDPAFCHLFAADGAAIANGASH